VRVIGLTGKARAGKDTACGFIKSWGFEHDIEVERAAFADKLKVSAARALGFEGNTAQCAAFCNELKQDGYKLVLHHPNNSELGPSRIGTPLVSGREFLQRYGTEAHRDVFDPEFWVKALMDEIYARSNQQTPLESARSVVVISDMRFENEARAVHNAGGEVWKVHRNDLAARLQDSLDAHSSEVGVPESLIDRVIPNDHDLADFEREVRLACVEALR
jgi:hypothetical protein